MNTRLVDEIANAVIYEGYILYPYRASAVKNRKRFNFGVLGPSANTESQPATATTAMQTECLVLGRPSTEIEVKVRFLQIVARVAGELADAPTESCHEISARFRPVDSVEVDGKFFSTWQEALERELALPACGLREIAAHPVRRDFSFPAKQEFEPLRAKDGQVVAALRRDQERLEGCVEISAQPVAVAGALTSGLGPASGAGTFRVRVGISNLTAPGIRDNADESLARSLVSTHTLLGVREGEFVSLLDPEEQFKGAVAACRNLGTFPVLAGEEGRRDMMLSSPIILYDYPQVAVESAGQFFDGTEIDEMLALRIMTLTDDEKREMSQLDEKARQLLERTESLPPEHMLKLHGVLRGLRPSEDNL
jgi:hydrogenase maturation protease